MGRLLIYLLLENDDDDDDDDVGRKHPLRSTVVEEECMSIDFILKDDEKEELEREVDLSANTLMEDVSNDIAITRTNNKEEEEEEEGEGSGNKQRVNLENACHVPILSISLVLCSCPPTNKQVLHSFSAAAGGSSTGEEKCILHPSNHGRKESEGRREKQSC